jgi:hypothetical protein
MGLAAWFMNGPADVAPRDAADVGRLFAGLTGAAPAFRDATAALGGLPSRELRPTLARPPELAPEGIARWHGEDTSADTSEVARGPLASKHEGAGDARL